MELEELKRKAKNKEIKLEDLDVEDILKFSKDMFLQPALREYFGLSDYEINKIRRLKGISNAEIEDFIRDIIVLYNFVNTVIPTMTYSFGKFKGKLDCYTKIVNEIDWKNMNPKPKAKKAKGEYNGKRSNRDNSIKERAIERANHLCEIDNNHKTFISRNTGKQYMEGHHLIPLEFEDLFPYSLDVEANVVSLCSICHDEIHHGVNYKELIDKLYEKRKDDLKKCGIEISDISYLYDMYDRIRIEELV